MRAYTLSHLKKNEPTHLKIDEVSIDTSPSTSSTSRTNKIRVDWLH